MQRHLTRTLIPRLPLRKMSTSALKFLVGGDGNTISVLSFNPSSKSIEVIKHNSGFSTSSWIESSALPGLQGKVFETVSESGGQAKSIELQDDGSVVETGSAPTGGNPAHSKSRQLELQLKLLLTLTTIPPSVHVLKDGSGVVATNVSRFISTRQAGRVPINMTQTLRSTWADPLSTSPPTDPPARSLPRLPQLNPSCPTSRSRSARSPLLWSSSP